LKTLLLEAKAAFLLEAGVPTRQETGKDVLYRYGEHSWSELLGTWESTALPPDT
jgi:hypothetical protein